MDLLLAGKTAIVTGSGGGAGKHTARTLAALGARIVVNDVLAEAAEATADDIRAEGGEAIAVAASVADVEGVDRIVAAGLDGFGRIDILVNNAVILRRHLIHETPVEDWDAMIAVNLRGNFLCNRAVVPHMIAAGTGRIVNMVSTAALGPVAGTSGYAASKGAITVMTALMAKELQFHDITVNALELMGGGGNGGMTGRTPMSEMTQRVRLAHGWWYPPQPTDMPEPEIPIPTPLGAMIAYLASDAAGYINGQVIGVAENSFRRWSYFAPDKVLEFDDAITPALLAERFPDTLGEGMANPRMVLPELPK